MKSPVEVSVVICTFNRGHMLGDCLESLAGQTIDPENFEVVIVDNNSKDHTKEVAGNFKSIFPNFKFVEEPSQGLSHARNKGFRSASAGWIIYLDDDAKAPPDFIERALWIIENFDFDCFGGMYSPWFKPGKKEWLPEDFGAKTKLLDEVGILEEEFVSGGIMAVKKSVLEELEGFSTHLGMKEKLGYGEECEFQLRLRKIGLKVGFDPLWEIKHCVMPHKLTLFWHLHSAYERGIVGELIHRESNPFKALFMVIRLLLSGIFKRLPAGLFKVWKDPHFYIENLVLHVCIPLATNLGRLKATMMSERLKNFKK
jgi:glucosyl-dolichyl phosphate glucuronosyltransferase